MKLRQIARIIAQRMRTHIPLMREVFEEVVYRALKHLLGKRRTALNLVYQAETLCQRLELPFSLRRVFHMLRSASNMHLHRWDLT